MARPAISVKGLWKQYQVGQIQEIHSTLYDLLAHAMKAPLRGRKPAPARPAESDKFWALSDVDFEVQRGEVIGVIGRNGAGKSTLLKVLSRITAPTRGRAEICGRLASLLEVGTGFHGELSGRENIYLNGAILGMKRAEIDRKFDDIVAFAEIAQFLDTPVKRYSSGMYIRLAFAVAAHLDVDVLVVDEVLAVGDAAFQERCLNKIEDVSKGGRTVLFVSHNLAAVSRLCQRGIVLTRGRVSFDGSADQAIGAYTSSLKLHEGLQKDDLLGTLGERLAITRITVDGDHQLFGLVFFPEQTISVAIRGAARETIHEFRLMIIIRKQGHHVVNLFDLREARDLPAGAFESTFAIPAFHLSPGAYSLEVGAFSKRNGEWLWTNQVSTFAVASKEYPEYDVTAEMGMINLPIWGTRVSLPEPSHGTAEPLVHGER